MSGRGLARRRRLLPRGYGFAVAGIAVGMAGLVALGALADRISRFIDGGHRFVLGQISVAGAGIGTGAGFTAGGLLRRQTIEAIRRVPGVAAIQAQVMLPLNPGTSELFSVNQELVLGVDLGVPSPNRNYPTSPIAEGRALSPPTAGTSSSAPSWRRVGRFAPDPTSGSASGSSRSSAFWSASSPRPTASLSCRSRTLAISGSASTPRSARCSCGRRPDPGGPQHRCGRGLGRRCGP